MAMIDDILNTAPGLRTEEQNNYLRGISSGSGSASPMQSATRGNWQGWKAQDLGAPGEDGGGGSGPPGVFRPDGTFQWYDGRTEPTVLIAEKDPSGAAYTDAQGTRVPVSVANANNLTKLGTPAADPDYNGGSLLSDVFRNGILPAAAIIGGGSALASGLGGAGSGFAMPAAGAVPSYAMPAAGALSTGGGGLVGGAEGALSGASDLVGGAAGSGAVSSGLAGAGAEGANAALGLGSGSTLGGLSTAATAGSALSRILDGTAKTEDYLSVGGNLAGAGLGAYGASQQSSALQDLASQYQAFGAPSRARFEASMSPGFDPTTIPGYKGALDSASGAIMSRLSTQGNPFGNPGGLIEANKQIVNGTALPAVQNYQQQNASAGGLSAYNAAAPGAASAAVNSNAGVYNALGYGATAATQPDNTQGVSNSLETILRNLAAKSATSGAGTGLS